MKIFKILLKQLKEYKRAAVIAPVFTALEVFLEVLIPFITASIIDKGIEAGNLNNVYLYGALMLVMAVLSLFSGVLAGKYAAAASTGLACNLRDGMYANAAQMILRIAIRCPLMLIFSMVMCFFINARLSMIFLTAVIVLAVVLFFIMSRTSRIFTQVFRSYDDLNASVQENVSAIRVVKAFVREDYEKQKFQKAAQRLYKLYTKAEGILVFNNPTMMLVQPCAINGEYSTRYLRQMHVCKASRSAHYAVALQTHI